MHIGVDVGGTNVGVGIVDDAGQIIFDDSFHTNNERQFDEIAGDIKLSIKKLLEENNISLSDIKSIGMGLPGVVDIENGVFISATNLKVDNYKIKEIFENEFKIPIHIENDARCAALAEALFGSAKGFDNSVTVTIGTGIGSGIIINKKIYRGFNNSAGEFGHTVLKVDGEPCNCGRRGCWERYASSTALRLMSIEAAKEHRNSLINKFSGWNFDRINSKIVFDAASQGDQVAVHILEKFYRYLAEGITNIINAVGPEVIVIGGGISNQGDKLTKPIIEFIKNSSISRYMGVPEIRTAKFKREAGIIGAAALETE